MVKKSLRAREKGSLVENRWRISIHAAFFVPRACFLFFKLNSFPLHSTRAQQKKLNGNIWYIGVL